MRVKFRRMAPIMPRLPPHRDVTTPKCYNATTPWRHNALMPQRDHNATTSQRHHTKMPQHHNAVQRRNATNCGWQRHKLPQLTEKRRKNFVKRIQESDPRSLAYQLLTWISKYQFPYHFSVWNRILCMWFLDHSLPIFSPLCLFILCYTFCVNTNHY